MTSQNQESHLSTYVITGANRGIGLALCQQLVKEKHQVVAICRNSSTELDALGIRVETDIDVGKDECIEQLKQRLADTKIDVLINNAGIGRVSNLDDINLDGIRECFEVNTLGPLRVSYALLDNLQSGAKIVIISSHAGSISENVKGRMFGYRSSKAAVNMIGKSLSIDLKPKGIAVYMLSPGYVKTDLTSNEGDLTAEQSASELSELINKLSFENSGEFWRIKDQQLTW